MKTSLFALLTAAALALTTTTGYSQVPYSGPSNPASGFYGNPPPPVPVVPGLANSVPPPTIPSPPPMSTTAVPQPALPQPALPQPALPLPAAPLPSKTAASDPMMPAHRNEFTNMNFDVNVTNSVHDDPRPSGYWTIGGGVYFMTPYYTSNPAFFTGNATGTNFALTDFHQHMTVSPLAWVGYTWDNGWGIRGRWFQFSGNAQAGFTADANTTEVGIPTAGTFGITPGTLVAATNNLRLNAYDLEATNLWVLGRWSFLASAGVRYVHYSQDYQFIALDPVFGNTTASSGNNFNGAGPTLSVEMRRLIGFNDGPGDGTRVYLYASARGSLLYGASHQFATGSIGFSVSDPNFVASQTTVVPVGELEIGAEWTNTFGRLRFFAQAAFIGQAWCGGNNASAGIAGFEFGTGVLSNFGFVGGVVRAGINF